MTEHDVGMSMAVSTALRSGMLAQLAEWRRTVQAHGQRLGWKIGFADRASQQRIGLTAPVLGFLRRDPQPFDLILLDVDNGPTMLSLPANEGLYTPEGLTCIRRWLAPQGVAVFWATEDAAAFERALAEQAGAQWSRETVSWRTARDGREFSDVLYFLADGE